MYRRKNLSIPLYKAKLVLIDTNDIGRMEKMFPGWDIEGYVFAHTIKGNIRGRDGFHRCIFIILNTHTDLSPITPGVIAHECLHAVGWIMDMKGCRHDIENDEPYAYLLEWMVNQVHKFLYYDK